MKNTSDRFSTTLGAKPDRVDRESGMIFGAKALQIGKLTHPDPRPWKVDRTTLEQLSTLVNGMSNGAKMRPGHPESSSMPVTLAKATNARIIDGGSQPAFVAIDAKFTASSQRVQGGELRNQIFDMAEETPEDFGLSIVPVLDRAAMKKPDADGLIPIRLSSLKAIDFVDDAAATSGGLFSTENEGEDTMSTTDHAAELATLKTEVETLKKANEGLAVELSTLKAKETPVDPKQAEKDAAKAELSRRGEITALCTLAKIGDADRDLFINAGFSRADAQDYLKASGRLSVANPPVSEGNNEPGENQPTVDEKFGAEYDKNKDIFSRQGITRDQFIFSRKVDEGLEVLTHKKPVKA